MSEKLRHNHEQQSNHTEKKHYHHETIRKHETHTSPERTHSKEAIYKAIESHAKSKDSLNITHTEKEHHQRPHHYITRSVKLGVYTHTIKRVQSQLKPTERVFSKIIHNDTIETISELGADTVGRSSAILGGGIVMVFAGLGLLLTARYFGFTIPLSSLIVLYVIGFILVFIVDIASKPVKNRRRKHN